MVVIEELEGLSSMIKMPKNGNIPIMDLRYHKIDEKKSNNIIIVDTGRYSINTNDLWIYFSRSPHKIVKFLVNKVATEKHGFWKSGKIVQPARSNIFDEIDMNLLVWKSLSGLKKNIDDTEFDYIAIGNGSCDVGEFLCKTYGRDKILFTEYGWLPWSETCYISRFGCGMQSYLAHLNEETLKRIEYKLEDIQALRDRVTQYHFKKNKNRIIYKDFVYIPLQSDSVQSNMKKDFKMRFSDFDSNMAFLRKVVPLIPAKYKILVKGHPFAQSNVSFEKIRLWDRRHNQHVDPARIIDITRDKWNNVDIYQKMKAMIAINSTSVIEAILYKKKVFTYGDDVFSNKGLTYNRINDKEEFEKLLEGKQDTYVFNRFIWVLMLSLIHI